MEKLIDGPLAAALEAGRPRFNALFAQARRNLPALDAAVFASHLRTVVEPLVIEVARVAPKAVPGVTEALFEFSLELVGKELVGRYPVLLEGWRTLLASIPQHLAASPRQLAGSVTNALYNLALVPEARPAEWIETMVQLGKSCPDVGLLLEAGKVAAWRAGLAHYRTGALETCARLPAETASLALSLRADGPPLDKLLERLRDDPWLRPSAPAGHEREVQIVRCAGGFRGFGGLFVRPPRIACVDGRLLVSDEEGCWALTADVFGATMQRVSEAFPTKASKMPDEVRIDTKGKVSFGKRSRVFEELENSTSAASDGTTLVVTAPWTHRVYLVALASGAA